MSFLGKIFGKKEEPSFESTFGKEKSFDDMDSGLNLPGMENQESNFDSFGNQKINRYSPYDQEPQQHNPYAQQPYQQQASGDTSKDLQIIIAKLDALRSEVANISHRLEALEKNHGGQQQKKFW